MQSISVPDKNSGIFAHLACGDLDPVWVQIEGSNFVSVFGEEFLLALISVHAEDNSQAGGVVDDSPVFQVFYVISYFVRLVPENKVQI